jgi:hypothetical protein
LSTKQDKTIAGDAYYKKDPTKKWRIMFAGKTAKFMLGSTGMAVPCPYKLRELVEAVKPDVRWLETRRGALVALNWKNAGRMPALPVPAALRFGGWLLITSQGP